MQGWSPTMPALMYFKHCMIFFSRPLMLFPFDLLVCDGFVSRSFNSHSLSYRFSCLVLRTIMGDKRDAAMAELPWPVTTRSATDLRATGLTPPNRTANSGTSIRPPDPADSEMTSDDIGNESFTDPGAPAPPPLYIPIRHRAPIPDQPWTHIRILRNWALDLQHHRLLPDAKPQFPLRTYGAHHLLQDLGPGHPRTLSLRGRDQPEWLPSRFWSWAFLSQADRMSDYWRQHYGLTMQHGGTPFQPTWTSPVAAPAPATIPAAAQQLATLLFGPHAVTPPTSSASSGSAPSLTAQGTTATANMPLDQLRQLALTLRDLSSSSWTLWPPWAAPMLDLLLAIYGLFRRKKTPLVGVCVCVCAWNIWTDVKLLPLFLLVSFLLPICRGHRCDPGSCANEDDQMSQWYQGETSLWHTCQQCFLHGMGLSREPHPRFGLFKHLHVRLPQTEHDRSLIFYWFELQFHFRTQRWTMNWQLPNWSTFLPFAFSYTEFPMNTS